MEGAAPQSNELSPEALEALRQELAPIFDERFVTLGHGTRIDVAEQILDKGLEMKYPKLQSTTVGLENSDEDLKKIMNWGHYDAKAVIVVMIPKDARLSMETQEEIIDPNNDSSEYGNPWVLPSRFIKGYVDVQNQKFVLNPNFEENPNIRPQHSRPAHRLRGEQGKSVDIPAPADTSSSDIF